MVGCGGGAFWWILGERASKLTIICPLGIRMRGPAMVVPSETPQSRRSRLRLPDLRAEAVAGIRTAFLAADHPDLAGLPDNILSSLGALSLATLAQRRFNRQVRAHSPSRAERRATRDRTPDVSSVA